MDDRTADFRRSRKGDLVDVGMGGERGSGRFPEAGHDIQDAIRESGFTRQLSQQEGGEGGFLGGLQDDGTPRGQGRAQLPRRHEQGKIPGNNLSDHTDGFSQGIGVELGPRRIRDGNRNRVAFYLRGPTCHVPE